MRGSHLTELKLTIGENGWGVLSVGSPSGSADVPISYVVDVVGKVVFAAVDVLRGEPDRQLVWDSEGDTATISMTRRPDDQVSLSMTWTSGKSATSSFAFDLSTVQPDVVLAERVLGLVDALDPATYRAEWTDSWPTHAIGILREWLADARARATSS